MGLLYFFPFFLFSFGVSSFDLHPDPRSHMGKRGWEDPQRSFSPRSWAHESEGYTRSPFWWRRSFEGFCFIYRESSLLIHCLLPGFEHAAPYVVSSLATLPPNPGFQICHFDTACPGGLIVNQLARTVAERTAWRYPGKCCPQPWRQKREERFERRALIYHKKTFLSSRWSQFPASGKNSAWMKSGSH